jgi:integrase
MKTPYSRTGEKSLTPKEYQKILTVCNTLEEEVLMKMAVGLGLRRRDIASVKISNIDLAEGKLTYHEHKKNRDRTVPLGPDLTQLLRKYISSLPKDQAFLFKWGKGKYGDRTAHRRLTFLCDRAGIPQRPFHALRATCIKFKQAEGWPVEATAKLIGDTIAVVQEHYATPSDAELRELMKEKEAI